MSDLDDLHQLWPLAESIEKTYGYVITAFDARDGQSITPAARRFIGEKNRQCPLIGPVLIMGSGFTLRTLVRLLLQAARVFGKRPAAVHFYTLPAELPTLLATQRQLFASSQRR